MIIRDQTEKNRSGSEVKKQEILKLLVTCVQSGTEESNQALDPKVSACRNDKKYELENANLERRGDLTA